MDRPLKVGAVMYDPKVSVIWEIIRTFFEAQACPIDVAFYSTYELQVAASARPDHRHRLELAARVARLAAPVRRHLPRHRHARHRSRPCLVLRRAATTGRCARSPTCGTGRSRPARAIRRRRPSFRSDDCGSTASIQRPTSPSAASTCSSASTAITSAASATPSNAAQRRGGGLRDARSELGRAGRSDGTIDADRFAIVAETDRFDHCVFTVRHDLDAASERRWLDALFAMRYDNPAHREMMDLEGLKAWLPGRTSGFARADRGRRRPSASSNGAAS